MAVFPNAAGDIWQHRVNNPYDWEDDWLFTDNRFDLMHGEDKVFLRFLCEMLHPVVRSDAEEVKELVTFFNEKLGADGFVLVATDYMSGRPVFEARPKGGAKHPTSALRIPEYQRLRDPQVFEEHLRRIEAGLLTDPAAAIASSKEMVESVCKIILDDYSVSYGPRDDLLALYKKVATELNLNAEAVPDSARGSQAAQGALRALVTVMQRLAELRNELGLGHGRSKLARRLLGTAVLPLMLPRQWQSFSSTHGMTAVRREVVRNLPRPRSGGCRRDRRDRVNQLLDRIACLYVALGLVDVLPSLFLSLQGLMLPDPVGRLKCLSKGKALAPNVAAECLEGPPD